MYNRQCTSSSSFWHLPLTDLLSHLPASPRSHSPTLTPRRTSALTRPSLHARSPSLPRPLTSRAYSPITCNRPRPRIASSVGDGASRVDEVFEALLLKATSAEEAAVLAESDLEARSFNGTDPASVALLEHLAALIRENARVGAVLQRENMSRLEAELAVHKVCPLILPQAHATPRATRGFLGVRCCVASAMRLTLHAHPHTRMHAHACRDTTPN